MMKILARYLALIPLLLSVQVFAVQVEGLYKSTVPVEDRSKETRQAAISEAMGEVLIKVSGQGSVALELLAGGYDIEPARYVRQYGYKTETVSGETGEMRQLMLQVQFDGDGIEDLLRRFGKPVWGTARPQTLVWLAVEEEGQRLLVGANDAGLAREVVLAAATRRGLPVRLPLLDLTDRTRVSTSDIWGDFHQNVVDGSQRYQPQAILIGRLYPLSGGMWGTRWTLYRDNDVFRWSNQSDDVEAIIAGGVGGAADYLSQVFSQTLDEADSRVVRMAINGVSSLKAYRRTMDYLSSIKAVSKMQLNQIQNGTVEVVMELAGGARQLVNILSLGDILVPEEPAVVTGTMDSSGSNSEPGLTRMDHHLVYRLVL